MARRRSTQGGVKVSNLTPDNVHVLNDALTRGQLHGLGLVTTATTAMFGVSSTLALQGVNHAIRQRKTAGQDTRALHAVRRKLEKLVEADRAGVPTGPGGCKHDTGRALGQGRAKCLTCGLVVDIHAAMTLEEDRDEALVGRMLNQRPATPSQPGVTSAQVIPAAPAAAAPQNGTRTVHVGDPDPAGLSITSPAYASIVHGDIYLVVKLGDGIQPGEVVATCATGSHAHQLVVALNRQAVTAR